jgi:geranylgeranyl diphosphate synthase type II
MHSPEFLQDRITEALTSLRLDLQPPELYLPIRYSMSMGGKRMRPLLTLMACDLVGGNISDALPAAIGIEIFHNFTLVHDDIMDNAPIRRGKETVFKKWDTNVAILSGDTMFALAYANIAQIRPELLPPVLEVFTTTAREVCEGQQSDMNFESREDTTLEEYLAMIRLKTAVLLACSLKIGALTGGADPDTANILYTFGEKLGIAFQIRDDLLDTYGDEVLFGKKTGGDILANKKTYLYLAALKYGSKEIKEELKVIYRGIAMEPETKIQRVRALFTAAGVESICEKVSTEYFNEAMIALKKMNYPEEQLLPLHGIAFNLLGRKF